MTEKEKLEALEVLKKYIKFKEGVLSVTISEYDKDFYKVAPLIEKKMF